MLRTYTSTLQMLHSVQRPSYVGGFNFSLCVDARASTSGASAVGDPMSCAVAIFVVESPPRYVWLGSSPLPLRLLFECLFVGLLPSVAPVVVVGAHLDASRITAPLPCENQGS